MNWNMLTMHDSPYEELKNENEALRKALLSIYNMRMSTTLIVPIEAIVKKALGRVVYDSKSRQGKSARQIRI